MIKLIDHKYCPQDPYIKEIAILEIPLRDDSKLRFVYIRKELKTGGLYWGPLNCSALIDGEKQYFKSPLFDSNFLEQDIKEFLNSRRWEKHTMARKEEDIIKPPQYEQAAFPDFGDPPF